MAINEDIYNKIEDHNDEITRLNRIDVRMNKELVQKPYLYIDRVKKELSDEQVEIVKTAKKNNDKFITRVIQIDKKVDDNLTETQKLIFEYKKRIKAVQADHQGIKDFKEIIEMRMNHQENRV